MESPSCTPVQPPSNGAVFQVGDRVVVVSGLPPTKTESEATEHPTTPSFNGNPGRHGIVAIVTNGGNDYKVHLDQLNPPTVTVQAKHMRQEEVPPCRSNTVDRAPVHDGVLGNDTGPHLIQVLFMMRWMVARDFVAPPDARTTGSPPHLLLQQMPLLPAEKSLALNTLALRHWGAVYYPKFLDYLENHHPYSDPVRRTFILQLARDPRALPAWRWGLVHDVWFVGRDYTGSYVVPDCNYFVVYKVVGLARGTVRNKNGSGDAYKQPSDPPSLNRIPTRRKITILPFRGRLLYDSTIPPPTLTEHTRPDSVAQASLLHTVVLQAIQAGTVIEWMAEVECAQRGDITP